MAPTFACIWGSPEQTILGGWSKVLGGPACPKRRWGTTAASMDVWVACTMRRISGAVATRRRQIARHWVAGLAEEVAVAREWEGDAGGGGGGEGKEELMQRLLGTIQAMASRAPASSSSGNPYDGAWVAMVPAVDGSVRPQFHAALNWVRGSQLPDGSWAADWRMFNLHDRLACTLACVLALATWSRAKDAVRRGCSFISTHLHEVGAEEVERTLGFEIVFCAMLERAEVLRLELPYHAPVITILRSERDRKLRQIPLEYRRSPLLESLEGLEKLPGLDWWKRLLELQAAAGDMLLCASFSFVSVPDADDNSLQYLDRLVDEVNWDLPQADVVERLWVVDRLHRLGIARYCQLEIRDFLTRFGLQKASPS